jgi:xanthine dehydrogenase small subunit
MRDFLLLYINGRRHQVRGAHAFLTLADYLRLVTGETGTKIVCSEGDCGSCSVLVGRPVGDQFAYHAVDACICFMHQLDGTHIVSVEGLAKNGQLHPVQQAMVDHFGSQCGFCTPGFVVTMAGLLEHRDRNGNTQDYLSEDELRAGLTGNLCRCTGYVQILEAGKAVRIDPQALLAARYSEAPILGDLSRHRRDNVTCVAAENGRTRTVFLPRNVPSAVSFKSSHPGAVIVNGATDIGVAYNKRQVDPDVILSLGNLGGQDELEVVDGELRAGMRTTWLQLEHWARSAWPELHRIIVRFGSSQIRTMSTLVGNIVNGSPIADSLPMLYVLHARIQLLGRRGPRDVDVNDFFLGYKRLDLRPDELVTGVCIPLVAADQVLRLYKVSKRNDLDISTFTAAILLELTDGVVQLARVAYGGVGPTVLRLPGVESFLLGKPFTSQTMGRAGELARREITPISDVRGEADYRSALAENILLKCYHDCVENAVS